MLHDVLVMIGVAAVFGRLFGWEVDALFLTALLTVVGFSVHDSIVVFDRIRENLLQTAASTTKLSSTTASSKPSTARSTPSSPSCSR